MASDVMPNVERQLGYYKELMDRAGNRKVIFRSLDVGSDKLLPYWSNMGEENPAIGWRSIRISLDRRAILRKPIDRIGYGGYLKLACQFPEFLDYVQSVCDEFRELYENIRGTTPYCVKTVAVLNCWGKIFKLRKNRYGKTWDIRNLMKKF